MLTNLDYSLHLRLLYNDRLIRSRSESELATLLTQVDKLKVMTCMLYFCIIISCNIKTMLYNLPQDLENVWSKSKVLNALPCQIDDEKQNNGININNLGYSRGSAEIMIDHLVIGPGIYAVTGANGELNC